MDFQSKCGPAGMCRDGRARDGIVVPVRGSPWTYIHAYVHSYRGPAAPAALPPDALLERTSAGAIE